MEEKPTFRAPFLFHLPESRSLYELCPSQSLYHTDGNRMWSSPPRHWQVLVQERFSLSNSTVEIATPSIGKAKRNKTLTFNVFNLPKKTCLAKRNKTLTFNVFNLPKKTCLYLKSLDLFTATSVQLKIIILSEINQKEK